MDYQDYYKTLGVNRDANEDAIRKAYRRLARRYHPDVSDEPEAESKFKEVSEAYEVLKDPEKRQLYDQLGSNWQSGQQFRPPPGFEGVFNFTGRTGGNTGFSDFFESLFGGGHFQGDFHDIPLHENGSGFAVRRPQRVQLIVTLDQLHDAEPIDVSLNNLGSNARASKPKHLKVKVPPGLTDGDTFRLKGQGDNNRDLLVELKVAKHPKFELRGVNVHSEIGISPWEAALGSSIQVDTLGGVVQLKIPAGTDSGAKMRLKGRGVGEGNHIVSLRIEVPKDLSEEERALFEKLREVSRFSAGR